MDYINKILCGNDLEILPQLPAESVSCVTCSPPYWSLRDYGVDPVIWDGVEGCEHEWLMEERKAADDRRGVGKRWQHKDAHYPNENPESYPNRSECYKHKVEIGFCSKCGAWRGSLGLEPTFELYIEHLCQIFDEVKRVLRKDGTCWVNMGDTYASSPAGSMGNQEGTDGVYKRLWDRHTQGGTSKVTPKPKKYNLPMKSLCDIPYRFSIEMINRGWIKRNTIIWEKPNCMPASADDRFTVDFEYLFFFTKNNKAIFWTNKKTLECVDKKPSGTKGIEGKDWEWKEPNQSSQILTPKDFETEWEYRKYIRAGKEYNSKEPYKSNTPGCKKIKRKKVSLWSGHDYWFEQQFEEQSSNTHFKGINPKTTSKFKDKSIGANNKVSHKDWHEYTPLTELPQGRNKRCVWIIPTQPFPEAHFAVYPEGLIEIPIKAGCPEFICRKCGKARVKIYEPTEEYKKYLGKGNLEEHHAGQETKTKFKVKANAEYKIKGYTDCGCNADFESGIVLDPFMGAGTTALVALKQRKRFIGIEIKQEYIDMSYKRIAKIQQVIF